MKASEARRITEEKILGSSNSEKTRIDARIEAAIKNHKFSVYIEPPSSSAVKILEDYYKSEGYQWKFNSPDQRDGGRSGILISW